MFPVTITLHQPAQLAAVLAALGEALPAAELTAGPAPAAEPVKPNKPKAAAKPAPAPAAEPEAPAAPTYQQAADLVTKLAREKGRDVAMGVLSTFGASKLPDVDPALFAEVIKACQQALDAE